jgi:type II secretory pathway pseudopilin PulG
VRKERGFTIIEVSLFLAISAAMLLLLSGVSMVVARQRFQDTMQTVRTTIQSQYEEVRSGINGRIGNMTGGSSAACGSDANTAAGASQCLVMGKILEFKSNEISISYVVSTSGAPTNTDQTDEAALRGMSLSVISSKEAGSQTSNQAIPWSGSFVGGWTIPAEYNSASGATNPSPAAVKYLIILRSPVSSAILTFTANQLGSGARFLANAYLNVPAVFLIGNGNSGFHGAGVCLAAGSSSDAVTTAIPADPYVTFNTQNTAATVKAPALKSLNELCGGKI